MPNVYNEQVNSVKTSNSKFCNNCGATIDSKAEICPKCGVRQSYPEKPSKDKLVAALLALFLGAFGIQYFYLGRKVAGILSLLFFWTGIPSLIGLIHGIMLLLSSDEDFAKKYLKLVS